MIKRYFAVCSCILALFSLVISAMAVDDPVDDYEIMQDFVQEDVVDDLSNDIIINDSVSGSEVISQLVQALSSRDDIIKNDPDLTLIDVNIRSVAPITGSGSGLKSALLDFIGDYDPVVVEYVYQSSQGYNQYLREIQPDYPWMISVAVLIVFIYCLFRLGGALLCKR